MAFVALLVFAAAIGAILGWVLSQGPRRREVDEMRGALERERIASDRQSARLRVDLEQAEFRSREQIEVFEILPDIVRQMFATTGRRAVGPLALRLVDRLFRPDQIAIFHLRRPRDAGVLDEDFLARPPERHIVLAAGQGLPPTLPHGVELEYGKGRVGYVAERREPMDDADFRGLNGFAKRQVEAHPPDFLVDVVVPIEDETGLVGLLSMGGARLRRGQEKRLLKMVADLTAVALTQATRLRTIEEAAYVDGLTGVYNKRYLQKRLGDELHRAEKEGAQLSLLILDIDHFKTYNDSHGHLEGDDVLKKVGRLLRESIRDDDVAARYGGEEFVVLYPGAAKNLAAKLAENLRRLVEAYPFAHRDRQPLGAVTISGGVATFPDDSHSAVGLLRRADEALYKAKSEGRNRIMEVRPNYLGES